MVKKELHDVNKWTYPVEENLANNLMFSAAGNFIWYCILYSVYQVTSDFFINYNNLHNIM